MHDLKKSGDFKDFLKNKSVKDIEEIVIVEERELSSRNDSHNIGSDDDLGHKESDIQQCLKFLSRNAKSLPKLTMAGLESLSMGYATLLTLTHRNPQLENKHHLNFIYLGLSFGLGAFADGLYQTKRITKHQYHRYEKIKDDILGAAVAAIFAESIYYPDEPPAQGVPKAIAVGLGIAIPLLAAKLTVDLFPHRDFFQRNFGRYLSRGLRSLYSVFMGAGSIDLLTSICLGFGVPVSNGVRYGVAAAAGLGHLIADIPLAKHAQDGIVSYGYKPAVFYESLLNGIEDFCLLSTLSFDAYVDSEGSGSGADHISPLVFYLIMSVFAVFGIMVTLSRYVANATPKNSNQEYQPLLASSSDVKRLSNSYSSGYLTRCCPSFWATHAENSKPETTRSKSFVNHCSDYLSQCWSKTSSNRKPTLEPLLLPTVESDLPDAYSCN